MEIIILIAIMVLSGLFFIALTVILWFLNKKHIKKKHKELEDFASLSGLTFIPPTRRTGPSFRGKYKNYDFELAYLYYDDESYSAVILNLPENINCDINIYRKKSFFDNMKPLIKTGDKEFDREFAIKTEDTEKMTKILTEELRRFLLSKRKSDQLHMDNNYISYKETGELNDMNEVNRILELQLNIIKLANPEFKEDKDLII